MAKLNDLDATRLLISKDTKTLISLLQSPNISTDDQLKLASKFLPIVEKYRHALSNELNTKIQSYTHK